MRRGRPSSFNQKVADAICARLAKGEPLAVICRDEGMPAVRTLSDWKVAHPQFSTDFAHARDEGFDAIAADCLEIADFTGNDTKIVGAGEEREGYEVANHEWIARSKVRIETRLKLLAKWDPKRYGDRLTHVGDKDADPVQFAGEIVTTFVRPGPPVED